MIHMGIFIKQLALFRIIAWRCKLILANVVFECCVCRLAAPRDTGVAGTGIAIACCPTGRGQARTTRTGHTGRWGWCSGIVSSRTTISGFVFKNASDVFGWSWFVRSIRTRNTIWSDRCPCADFWWTIAKCTWIYPSAPCRTKSKVIFSFRIGNWFKFASAGWLQCHAAVTEWKRVCDTWGYPWATRATNHYVVWTIIPSCAWPTFVSVWRVYVCWACKIGRVCRDGDQQHRRTQTTH